MSAFPCQIEAAEMNSSRIRDLERQVFDLRRENAALRGENSALRREMNDLRAEVLSMKYRCPILSTTGVSDEEVLPVNRDRDGDPDVLDCVRSQPA